MLTGNVPLLAIVLAFFGGIAAALYRFSKERKNPESSYDWVDMAIESVTASFAGLLGFYAGHWKFGNSEIVLVITGLSATGGYSMLVAIKDDAYLLVKTKLNTQIPAVTRRKNLIVTPTYTGPDRRKADR